MSETLSLPMQIYHPGGEVEESTYTPDGYDNHNMDVALDAAQKAGQAGDNAIGCAYMLDKGSLGTLFLAAPKADVPGFFRNSDTLDHIWRKTRRTLKVVKGLQQARAIDILTTYQKKH